MPCFSPLHGFVARKLNSSGKRSVVFNSRDGYVDMPVSVPCGRCIGCRLERSRQWAVRCVHEASLYESNCFITLTYDDEHLPHDRSLNLRHFQLFMKKLRKRFGNGIRFFHCGEYGENFFRPHYHACLFNFDFPDKKLWSNSKGVRLYTSATLQELWPHGFSTVGDVTFESAAYVARYVMKKITGDAASDHYRVIDEVTGQIHNLSPEYVTMSRRPGIGKGWFDKFHLEVYPFDEVIVRGVSCRPPRYYDTVYDVLHPSNMFRVKSLRKADARKNSCDNGDSRLLVKREVCMAKVSMLKRSL